VSTVDSVRHSRNWYSRKVVNCGQHVLPIVDERHRLDDKTCSIVLHPIGTGSLRLAGWDVSTDEQAS